MLDVTLRERLSLLHRDRDTTSASPVPAVATTSAGSSAASSRALPAGEACATPVGECYRLRRPLRQLWSEADRELERWSTIRASLDLQQHHPELQGLASNLPEATLFLDLETCGFAGSIVFLVGLLHTVDGEPTLTQLLARNYAEERAVLHELWSLAAGCRVLVTFNGKSFDWPAVHDRSTLHRLGRDPRSTSDVGKSDAANEPSDLRAVQRVNLQHCDLLHHSRRRWKRRLPNCKLQTLERWICGRRRVGDIPGGEIPQAYHQFVRSGDAWEMRSILHHNALDLATLFQLALRILV